ncbi:MAG: AAA family ATPase [Phycisphaerae bacterium]|nr:AAA family ATPase [Phycisphaerae bacterium]
MDAVMLRTYLTERNTLDKAGGVDYLVKILNAVPSAANAAHYAETVREKLKRRRLIAMGERIQNEIDSTGSTGESVFKIQQLVSGLDGAIEPVSGSQPVIKSLADVKALPINYLWFNKIPMGMLTLIQGGTGLGKSFLTLYLASKVSTGESWPDGDGLPDNKAL